MPRARTRGRSRATCRSHCRRTGWRSREARSAADANLPGVPDESQGRIQVLDKVAALLERLGEHGESSAVQLAEWIGEPRSSVYRLLDGLRALGWVEHGSRRGTYRLGLEL